MTTFSFMMNSLEKKDLLAPALGSRVGDIGKVRMQLGRSLSGPIRTYCLCAVSKSAGMNHAWER